MFYYQELDNNERLVGLNLKDFKYYLKDVKNNGWSPEQICIPRRYFRENRRPKAVKQYLSREFLLKLW